MQGAVAISETLSPDEAFFCTLLGFVPEPVHNFRRDEPRPSIAPAAAARHCACAQSGREAPAHYGPARKEPARR